MLKGVPRIIRDKLPRHKINLNLTPQLTKYLVSQDDIDYRREKLEVYKFYLPTRSDTRLLEEILIPPGDDVDFVLKKIDQELDNMNSFYLAVSFEGLDDLVKNQLCDPHTILVAPEFKRLCYRTLYKMRFFEADELVKIMKCFASVNMPQNTVIYQAALKMTRELINDFDIEELEVVVDSIRLTHIGQPETTPSLEGPDGKLNPNPKMDHLDSKGHQ